VLDARLQVAVPTRIALSVLAWCDAGGAVRRAPGPATSRDVLVVGQNPVPGRSTVQVASRRLAGRAVVDLPAGRRARCVLQVSPRTESTTGSRLRLLSGRFTAVPAVVAARAAEHGSPLVGPAQGRVREVARLAAGTLPGAVRAEGEVELTTCALGYHRCPRGRSVPSVGDVRLVLRDVDGVGRVCRTWYGSARRFTITAAVHHVKVAAPSAALRTRCGTGLRAALLVRHRSGDAVEVEPTLRPPGSPARVQTHLWLARP
jgi:hypothetical protein